MSFARCMYVRITFSPSPAALFLSLFKKLRGHERVYECCRRTAARFCPPQASRPIPVSTRLPSRVTQPLLGSCLAILNQHGSDGLVCVSCLLFPSSSSAFLPQSARSIRGWAKQSCLRHAFTAG